MANLLLLYDTNESELARDFRDFLKELNIKDVTMIPLSQNIGKTLEDKEKHYFNSAKGALFIITPRLNQDGKWYCSPSVNVEIGSARERFKPEQLFLLLEKSCEQPAVIQKPYIPFIRDDMRSIIQALTLLIIDLKGAGFLCSTPQPEKFDLEVLLQKTGYHINRVLLYMTKQKSGIISDVALVSFLTLNFGFNTQKVNFLKRKLRSLNVAEPIPYSAGEWRLTPNGWDIAEAEAKKEEEAVQKGIHSLVGKMGLRKTNKTK